jgi:hypothetical protein
VPAAPAVSCALCIGRTHTSNNEYTRNTRHSRTQWFYGLCRALPGDRALLPPSPADMFCLSPVGPTQLRELDASVGASGPHDFAVRNNISRQRAVDRSQAHHLPCDPIARKTLPRPPHPAPNVRDDRETPLLVGRDGRSCRCDLGGTKTEIFLQTGLDRKIGTTPDGQISSIDGRSDETLRYQVKLEGYSLVSRTRRSVLRCSAEPDPCQIKCTVTVTRWREAHDETSASPYAASQSFLSTLFSRCPVGQAMHAGRELR